MTARAYPVRHAHAGRCEQEATETTEPDSILCLLSFLLVTPAMAGGSNRLKSIDDENCPFNI